MGNVGSPYNEISFTHAEEEKTGAYRNTDGYAIILLSERNQAPKNTFLREKKKGG